MEILLSFSVHNMHLAGIGYYYEMLAATEKWILLLNFKRNEFTRNVFIFEKDINLSVFNTLKDFQYNENTKDTINLTTVIN